MAEELKEFIWETPRGSYPWDEWLNGKIWLLRKGEDYETKRSVNFRAAVYQAATKRGKKARTTSIEDDRGEAVVIQAYEDADSQ